MKKHQLVQTLIKLGAKKVVYESKKHEVFVFPNSDILYFVGRNGGLKTGKSISKAKGVNQEYQDMLMNLANRK